MTTMEDLTKTQIVLLSLLVTFITSIATGIITTSLLAQAPAGVTQTIDRVVERTIEKVVPAQSGGGTVREVTIVKEDDAVVSSIESVSKAVVRIKAPNDEFYAMGVIINKEGNIISDKRTVLPNSTYTVVFSDGTTLPAAITKVGDGSSLVVFKLIADESKLRSLPVVELSDTDPKLGQTVIAIQGVEKTSVAVGRVISVDTAANSAMTDINPTTETQGGPLLNLSGELIGFKTSNADLSLPASSYMVISPISQFVSSNS